MQTNTLRTFGSFIAGLIVFSSISIAADVAPSLLPPLDKLKKLPVDSPERIEMLRLQILLDASHFRPGRMDGLPGEFTEKALVRYQQANALPIDTLPDLTSVPVDPFVEYIVTKEDLRWIGTISTSPAAMAKLSRTPYGNVWEMLAEKFHCHEGYMRDLNKGLTKGKVAADTVIRVPAITPFAMSAVEALHKVRKEEAAAKKAAAAAQIADSSATPAVTSSTAAVTSSAPALATPSTPAKIRIRLLRKDRIIEIYDDANTMTASYPITVSQRVPVKPGNYKIMNNILLPEFRYDKSVLKNGVKSDNFHEIPPGPNNFVGVVWMGINRPSTGMHGTNTPDQIGRNESSGCIRMANWDAFEVCQIAAVGTPVKVE